MKFAIVALFIVFAFSSCNEDYTELEAFMEKNDIIECMNGWKVVIQDVVAAINLIKEEKWEELLPLGIEIYTHVKEAIEKCPFKKEETQGDIVLEKKFWKKVKNAFNKGKKIFNKGKEIYNKVKDVYNKGKKIYEVGKKVWDVAKIFF